MDVRLHHLFCALGCVSSCTSRGSWYLRLGVVEDGKAIQSLLVECPPQQYRKEGAP
jgi:hypothetical protein